MSLDLVVLGNLLVDDVVYPDGRTRMGEPGGAVIYAALGASLWGARTGVVSVRGDDYPESALAALAARGVDVGGIRRLGRPGLRTWLLYEGRRRQVLHQLDRPTHAEVSPVVGDIPPGWRSARAFHLAPMPMDVQGRLVEALGAFAGARVSVDPYVLLRPETREEWRVLLTGADLFFLSEDEMEIPGAAAEPRPVLRSLVGGRLRLVAFKRGARGGILYDASQDRFIEWPTRAAAVVDPTGAGDAFAGGFLAGLQRGAAPERALLCGVVSASFAIEEWGAAGLFAATPARAEARLREWFGP